MATQRAVLPQETGFAFTPVNGVTALLTPTTSCEFLWDNLRASGNREELLALQQRLLNESGNYVAADTASFGSGSYTPSLAGDDASSNINVEELMSMLTSGANGNAVDWANAMLSEAEEPVDRSALTPTWNLHEPKHFADFASDEDIKENMRDVDFDNLVKQEKMDEDEEDHDEDHDESAASPSSTGSTEPPSGRTRHPRASKTRARAIQKRLACDFLDGRSEDSSLAPLIGEPPGKKRMIKKKLYEHEAFEDPALERCRQNAINAKRNRDRRKKEKEALSKQMNGLRDSNRRLKDDNDRLEAKADLIAQKYNALSRVLLQHGRGHLLAEAAALLSQTQQPAVATPTAASACGRHHKTAQARHACPTCSGTTRGK